MGARSTMFPTPLTIGREEGNSVQLNDERVSRFHVKIQDDQEKIVLTDLQSTNGTKVNGESVHLWVLRPGDVVTLGRTVLVYGSRDEIATRLAELRGADMKAGVEMDPERQIQRIPPSPLTLNCTLATRRTGKQRFIPFCLPKYRTTCRSARRRKSPSCSSISICDCAV